ncbi:MAG TPA: hypothetical protein VEW46_25490 [Pyrinomonadaceae bacterium]|nr:hypothetical protein [Pyrinomonadaceae bacterium]
MRTNRIRVMLTLAAIAIACGDLKFAAAQRGSAANELAGTSGKLVKLNKLQSWATAQKWSRQHIRGWHLSRSDVISTVASAR